MNSLIVGYSCAILMLIGAGLGMFLRERLPEHHLKDDSKDTIKVGAGIVSTVAALVLGLLVSSAKESFDTMNSEVTVSASKILLLDRLLANYGSESSAVRAALRESFTKVVNQVWSSDSGRQGYDLGRSNYLEDVDHKLLQLKPTTDEQRTYLSSASQLVVDLRQTKWLLVEQSHNELPFAFLVVLVFWLVMMHISFGLFAPRNNTSYIVFLVTSISMAGAIFLILELNHPMHGIIRVGGATMQNALVELLHK